MQIEVGLTLEHIPAPYISDSMTVAALRSPSISSGPIMTHSDRTRVTVTRP